MNNNPLLKFQTKPGTFVKLPSGGKFYKTAPELSIDGELEVLPMNAMDELQMMNPDGLINNESLFTVISHIAPGIKNVKEIVVPDLDVIFIAMRVITYGPEMDINTTCPKCDQKDSYTMSLLPVLSSIKPISTNTQLIIDNFKINIQPYTLQSQTKLNEYMMNVQRAARKLQNLISDDNSEDETDEYKAEMSAAVNKNAQELFKVAAYSIVSVVTDDDSSVTDQSFIFEWLGSLPAPKYQKIKDAITELSKSCINRTFKYVCNNEKCKSENELEIDFDPGNFFVSN